MTEKNGKEAYLEGSRQKSKRRRLHGRREGTEGATFTIERNKDGEIKRTCAPAKAGTRLPDGSG